MLHYISALPAVSADAFKELTHPVLGEAPFVHPTAIVRDSHLGSWTDIGPNSHIVESTFGDYSYAAGDLTLIYGEVGKFCSIASHVRINPGNHPMDRVTQHHCTYRRVQYRLDTLDDENFFNWRRAQRCVIGHDVWIGHGAIILPGVHVETGAVVGAGAVVTKNVAPYDVVVGVPAQPIRQRFPEAVFRQLLQIAWWDWDRPTLEERFRDFLDLDTFLKKYAV